MKTSELSRLAKICLQKEINLNWDNYDKKIKVADIYGHIIDAMLSFHEQASRDIWEFVEWAIINVAILGVKGKFQLIDCPALEFDSLDELSQYYWTNIKNK